MFSFYFYNLPYIKQMNKQRITSINLQFTKQKHLPSNNNVLLCPPDIKKLSETKQSSLLHSRDNKKYIEKSKCFINHVFDSQKSQKLLFKSDSQRNPHWRNNFKLNNSQLFLNFDSKQNIFKEVPSNKSLISSITCDGRSGLFESIQNIKDPHNSSISLQNSILVESKHYNKRKQLSFSKIKPKPKPIAMFNVKKQDFILGRLLGKGGFGKVYLVQHKYTGSFYAMKQILKQQIIDKQQFCQSLRLHYSLRHTNICQLYAVFDDQKSIYLLLQLCSDGTLSKMKKDTSQKLKDRTIQGLFNGMAYLHSKNIRHGDIKLQNILLSYGMVKLTDFDCIVQMKSRSQKIIRSSANTWGSPVYFSPQMILQSLFHLSDDMWALGICLYEVYFGSHPFQLKGKEDLCKIVDKQIILFPKNMKQNIKFIIVHLLDKSVQKRLTIDEAIYILNKK